MAARSVSTAATQYQSRCKDSAMVQRALDLVHKGRLTARVAIKVFGIPKTTFYRKLSLCKQQPQVMSTADGEAERCYNVDFGTDDFGVGSGDIADC